MSPRTLAGLFLVFITGLLATFVATSWITNSTQEQRLEIRDQGAEIIAEDIATRVDAALTAAEGVSFAADSKWPTVEEYEGFWRSYSSVLPGNPTSGLILGVPTEDLDDFVAAELKVNPAFELSFLNDDPPDGQSLIFIRSGNSEISLGVDLTSLPGGIESFSGIATESYSLTNAEIREAAPQPGFLQAIWRQEVNGPTGVLRDAWSLIQIDLQWILNDAIDQAGEGFGATFEMVDIGPGGTYGTEASNDFDKTVRNIDAGDVQLTMQLWNDGGSIGDGSAKQVVIGGLVATLALTLLSYLVVALNANRRRARQGESEARHDPLTGLANRRWVGEHLDGLVDQPVAVLFCDLDRFKVVNDSAGHAAGDDLLIEVGARIDQTVGENAHVARFGGDEFLVVCSHDDDIEKHAETVAEQIRSILEEPFNISGNDFQATISIGIAATKSMHPSEPEELIRAADVALGLSKQAGRNGIVRYDDSLREAELDRLKLERDLQDTLDQGDLAMYYQPIVDLQHRPVSYEALVRWKRNGSVVPPDVFLPVVAEIGRMSDLGDIVLNLAVSQFAAGIDPDSSTTLHVNVDSVQLADKAFAGKVATVLQRYDLDPGRLVLELTEGEWAESIDSIGPVLDALADLHVRLAIDDFGTGHSSLGRALDVKALAEVKLDRSVISQLFEPRNHAFFSGLTSTLVDIGVTVIAEGIETVEDLRCTQDAGIGLFQGYMFARPAPAEEVNFASQEPLGPIADQVAPSRPVDQPTYSDQRP